MKDNDFKTKFKSTGEVLKSLFDDRQKGGVVAEQFLRWKLWMNWSDVVGQSIAEHTEPVSYHNGTLWVWVKNATWLQQMTFMSESMINTIHRKFKPGYVKNIKWTLDRKSLPLDHEQLQAQIKKMVDRK
jgi:predicted nucleic acid-binding Zn ribbon protein